MTAADPKINPRLSLLASRFSSMQEGQSPYRPILARTGSQIAAEAEAAYVPTRYLRRRGIDTGGQLGARTSQLPFTLGLCLPPVLRIPACRRGSTPSCRYAICIKL